MYKFRDLQRGQCFAYHLWLGRLWACQFLLQTVLLGAPEKTYGEVSANFITSKFI